MLRFTSHCRRYQARRSFRTFASARVVESGFPACPSVCSRWNEKGVENSQTRQIQLSSSAAPWATRSSRHPLRASDRLSLQCYESLIGLIKVGFAPVRYLRARARGVESADKFAPNIVPEGRIKSFATVSEPEAAAACRFAGNCRRNRAAWR